MSTINLVKAAEVQDMLCRSDGDIWTSIQDAKNSLERLTSAVATAADKSRAIAYYSKNTRGGEALILLREIYEASKVRGKHRGRLLRKAQWDKVVKLMEKIK